MGLSHKQPEVTSEFTIHLTQKTPQIRRFKSLCVYFKNTRETAQAIKACRAAKPPSI